MTPHEERATVHYSGRVQGVGFRWRVRTAAEAHRVTGFVANLRDGRVLLVAEGERDEIERFLGEVRERLADHVADAAVAWGAATGEFGDFDVRRV